MKRAIRRLKIPLALALTLVLCTQSYAMLRIRDQFGIKKEKLARSVVSIVVFDKFGLPLRRGSGFFVSKDGDVLTNHHILQGGVKAIVFTSKGVEGDVLTVKRHRSSADLALLKTTSRDTFPLTIDFSNTLDVGDEVTIIGGSTEENKTIASKGKVVNLKKSGFKKFFEVTAPITPGASGGPVFSNDGNVIGVAASYPHLGPEFNFVIPIKYMKLMVGVHTKISKLQKTKINIDTKVSTRSLIDIHSVHYDAVKYRNRKDITLNGMDFVVQNNSKFAIKNLKLILIYKDFFGKMLSHSNVNIEGPIPAKLAIQLNKKHRVNHWANRSIPFIHGKTDLRILDYEIVTN